MYQKIVFFISLSLQVSFSTCVWFSNYVEEETRLSEVGKFVEDTQLGMDGVGFGMPGAWPQSLSLLHPRILSASFFTPAGYNFDSVFPSRDYLKKQFVILCFLLPLLLSLREGRNNNLLHIIFFD